MDNPDDVDTADETADGLGRTSTGDPLDDVDVSAMADWRCNQFAMARVASEVPELLRRVADVIERIDGFRLLSMLVSVCDGEATASVQYRRRAD